MADLDKYISDLLFEYDCVIVPQLGGFVTNYRPAQIDKDRGIAHPPKKDIGFNRNLTRSDGLLEQAFAQSNSISIQEASSLVKKEVEGYWEKLNSGNKIKFRKIGVLFFDADQKLHFEPSGELNYLKASFGLDTFTLPERVIQTHEERAEKETKVIPFEPAEEVAEMEEALPAKSRSIYWVAAASILPFIAMSIYFGVKTDFRSPTETSFAELIPGLNFKKARAEYQARTADENPISADEAIAFPTDSVFPYSFIESKIDSTGVWVDLRKERSFTIPEKTYGPYHIITGCFSYQKNAEKYVSRLQAKGYDASILDFHKNLHRVRISSHADRQDALQSLKKIRTEDGFPKAWLLKKRTNS
jgi:hypothetical protein